MWFSRMPEAVLESHWGMLDRYCVDCHNDAEFTAGLSLEGRKPEDVVADAAVWEKAIHKLSIGVMPPREEPQPAPEVRAEFVSALEGILDAAAREHPYAGMAACKTRDKVFSHLGKGSLSAIIGWPAEANVPSLRR